MPEQHSLKYNMKNHLLISLIILGFSITGCKKCKECYFIEEVNGVTNEFALGEFCGEEIEEKENEEFTSVSGVCYNECR